MGDHTQFNILCAYCNEEATKQIIMDIGTRYVCDEHMTRYSNYWPVRNVPQEYGKNPCGVWYDDETRDKVEDSYIRTDGENKTPFFAPVLVYGETAEYLMKIMDKHAGDYSVQAEFHDVDPEFEAKLGDLYEQLRKAYEQTDKFDSINSCGRYSTCRSIGVPLDKQNTEGTNHTCMGGGPAFWDRNQFGDSCPWDCGFKVGDTPVGN